MANRKSVVAAASPTQGATIIPFPASAIVRFRPKNAHQEAMFGGACDAAMVAVEVLRQLKARGRIA